MPTHVACNSDFSGDDDYFRDVIAFDQADSTVNVIDLLLVTDLEVPPIGNGAKRRKR
ncbi:MAG: hypothetical protein ACREHD_12505 [Pirellulales bacterium]